MALLGFLTACQTPKKDPEFQSLGALKNVMHKGDLTPAADLNQLPIDDQTYGVGPLSGLSGEVTIYRGQPYVSTIDKDGKEQVRVDESAKAVFLAYGKVEKWRAYTINKRINSLKSLESTLASFMKLAGLDTEKPLAFHIEGKAKDVVYHVLNRKEGDPVGHAHHDKIKVKFDVKYLEGSFVGVWADKDGPTRYVHHGDRIHVHFVANDKKRSGHVDKLKLEAGAKLYLPDIR